MPDDRKILISIDDEVVALDVEEALAGAGYSVLRHRHGSEMPASSALSAAAIDSDAFAGSAISLARAVHRIGLPCLVFASDASGNELPPDLHGLVMGKPFASADLIRRLELDAGGARVSRATALA